MAANKIVNGIASQAAEAKKRMTKEDDEGKLFVGGLSYETTKGNLVSLILKLCFKFESSSTQVVKYIKGYL